MKKTIFVIFSIVIGLYIILVGYNIGNKVHTKEGLIDDKLNDSCFYPVEIRLYDQTTATDSAMYYEFLVGQTIREFFPRNGMNFKLYIGPFYGHIVLEDIDYKQRDEYISFIKESLGISEDFSTGYYCRDSLYSWPIFEDFKELTGYYDLGEVWMRDVSEWYTLSTGCRNRYATLYTGEDAIFWVHLNYFRIFSWRQFHSHKANRKFKIDIYPVTIH